MNTKKIFQQKKELKSRLRAWRDSAYIFIYASFCNGRTPKQIRSDLIKDTQKRRYIPLALLKQTFRTINFIKNNVNTTNEESPFFFIPNIKSKKNNDTIFKLAERSKFTMHTNKVINEEAQKFETEEKQKIINETLSNDENIFILVSSHGDCAKDHLNYQGKLYLNKDYQDKINKSKNKNEILKRINEENIKPFEWVINKPVWMITRPNCRHFFNEIDTNEVLTHTTQYLLRKHKMKLANGDRKIFQTIKHKTTSDWYTIENVQSLIEKYKERLEVHKTMNKVAPCDKLRMAIEKDKLLIKKWNEYLKTLKK